MLPSNNNPKANPKKLSTIENYNNLTEKAPLNFQQKELLPTKEEDGDSGYNSSSEDIRIPPSSSLSKLTTGTTQQNKKNSIATKVQELAANIADSDNKKNTSQILCNTISGLDPNADPSKKKAGQVVMGDFADLNRKITTTDKNGNIVTYSVDDLLTKNKDTGKRLIDTLDYSVSEKILDRTMNYQHNKKTIFNKKANLIFINFLKVFGTVALVFGILSAIVGVLGLFSITFIAGPVMAGIGLAVGIVGATIGVSILTKTIIKYFSNKKTIKLNEKTYQKNKELRSELQSAQRIKSTSLSTLMAFNPTLDNKTTNIALKTQPIVSSISSNTASVSSEKKSQLKLQVPSLLETIQKKNTIVEKKLLETQSIIPLKLNDAQQQKNNVVPTSIDNSSKYDLKNNTTKSNIINNKESGPFEKAEKNRPSIRRKISSNDSGVSSYSGSNTSSTRNF